MKKVKMAVLTILTAALLMAWALPGISAEGEKVNINTAAKELLLTLDGIGESYADRIIQYREQNGPFQSAEDILKVKGIGDKTYEMNKNRIVVKDE